MRMKGASMLDVVASHRVARIVSDFGDLPKIRQRLNISPKYRDYIALLELESENGIAEACVIYVVPDGKNHDHQVEIARRFGLQLQETKSTGGLRYRLLDPIQVTGPLLGMVNASEELGKIKPLSKIQSIQATKASMDSSTNPEVVFRDVMENAIRVGASDVHWCIRETSGAVLFRIHGVLRRWKRYPADVLTKSVAHGYNSLKLEGTQSHPIFDRNEMQSGMIALKDLLGADVNLRWQSAYCVGGFDVVARLLKNAVANQVRTLDELGYTPWQCAKLAHAASRNYGGIFIAGVTGSGKTTTLNTMTQMNPNRHLKKTMAIEDPVEYRQKMVTQISVQRKIDNKGGEENSFAPAMRAILRMDPDNVIFGEIRDMESATVAQAAIETGHLVMATVHASSATGIIPRLTSKLIGLERDSISSDDFLSTLIYQRLVPTNCPHCKIPLMSDQSGRASSLIGLLETKYQIDPESVFVASDEGCSHCRIEGLAEADNSKLGVAGVTVTAEIITPDLTFLGLVRDAKDNEAKLNWRKSRSHDFHEDNMQGKTAFEHAMFECSQGRLDPYYIEDSFESLSGYQIISRT